MMTFGVWRWNDAKGGMRFAFPPYGPTALKMALVDVLQPGLMETVRVINQAG
jgi:hypothetical protein